MQSRGRIIVLSGPSCVGKGPLYHALTIFYPDLVRNIQKLILYNSRKPRAGEIEGIDYYFRSEDQIKAMAKSRRFILLEVRGDLQGVDLDELSEFLNQGKDILFEGNPYIPQAIWSLPSMAQVEIIKVFLSPLSKKEIIWFKSHSIDMYQMLTDIMRRKLLRRTQKQKGILALPDLQNIEKRAKSAPLEMCLAWQFDWIIPNHDGEDSENWNAFYYPVGDAFNALHNFASILRGDTAAAEHWESDLWDKRLSPALENN